MNFIYVVFSNTCSVLNSDYFLVDLQESGNSCIRFFAPLLEGTLDF